MHVSSIKIDPYLNVDAGTMNPKEYVWTVKPLACSKPDSYLLRKGMVNVLSSTTVVRSILTWATTNVISTSL